MKYLKNKMNIPMHCPEYKFTLGTTGLGERCIQRIIYKKMLKGL